MTPDPTVTAVSDERLDELIVLIAHHKPDTYNGDMARALRELKRARSALADVGEAIELPQGVKPVSEQRLREIMSSYAEFPQAGLFEIRSLAYEVRNWRMKQPRSAAEVSLIDRVVRDLEQSGCSGTAQLVRDNFRVQSVSPAAEVCTYPKCECAPIERCVPESPAAHTAQATARLSSAPWRVVKGKENVGHGWPVAFMGCDHNGDNWYIETHGVHASEAVSEPENDAKAIVAWRNSLAEQGSGEK